jgi:hypothetical protein
VGPGLKVEVDCHHTPPDLPSPIERDACKRREAHCHYLSFTDVHATTGDATATAIPLRPTTSPRLDFTAATDTDSMTDSSSQADGR